MDSRSSTSEYIYWPEGANNLADLALAHEPYHAIMPYIVTSLA